MSWENSPACHYKWVLPSLWHNKEIIEVKGKILLFGVGENKRIFTRCYFHDEAMPHMIHPVFCKSKFFHNLVKWNSDFTSWCLANCLWYMIFIWWLLFCMHHSISVTNLYLSQWSRRPHLLSLEAGQASGCYGPCNAERGQWGTSSSWSAQHTPLVP